MVPHYDSSHNLKDFYVDCNEIVFENHTGLIMSYNNFLEKGAYTLNVT